MKHQRLIVRYIQVLGATSISAEAKKGDELVPETVPEEGEEGGEDAEVEVNPEPDNLKN